MAQERGLVNNKVSWAAEKAYGMALKAFTENKVKASTAALFALQGHFAKHNFPLGEKGHAILPISFKALYDDDVIETNAYNAWRDDIRNSTPGKDKALLQTRECVCLCAPPPSRAPSRYGAPI